MRGVDTELMLQAAWWFVVARVHTTPDVAMCPGDGGDAAWGLR